MRAKLTVAYNVEMNGAMRCYKKKDWDLAFYHLERAHILGQSYILPHTKSHWWMLKIAVRKSDAGACVGQVTRIIAAIIFSRIWVPLGNTGGANVKPLKPMPIPEDLQRILDDKT